MRVAGSYSSAPAPVDYLIENLPKKKEFVLTNHLVVNLLGLHLFVNLWGLHLFVNLFGLLFVVHIVNNSPL